MYHRKRLFAQTNEYCPYCMGAVIFFNYFSYCLLLPLSASGGAIYWRLHDRKWRRRHLGCHAKMQPKMTLSSDLSPIRCSPLPESFIAYSWIIIPRRCLKKSDKKCKHCHTREHNQRVLVHGHQGWNGPHGLCHSDIISICTKNLLVHLPESEFQTPVSLFSCLNFTRPSYIFTSPNGFSLVLGFGLVLFPQTVIF